MTSKEIRQKFLDFFESKEHKIVPSAPIVVKDDPTLMFNNAGMNQFKDYFLGNKTADIPRIADTQKCLRVSGKHNDLDEVGRDSYHHTMFEMLGNWSFGNYFKIEAIEWAWELLTKEFGLDPSRLYVSVFEGDKSEGLEADEEAADIWAKFVPRERILYFDKSDNFWEMGDTGPCGPCSEIHYDLRPEEERKLKDAKSLVNADSPMVVEIWNLVFIQFNRKADGSLEELPAKHVDTGMGFERLCMALQGKTSNYDTDLFAPFIQFIEKASGKKYTGSYEPSAKVDIAMRVIADHVRAVSFAIADGQLPSNTGAGYVIRRILRRAVRYYFSFLDLKRPFLNELVPLLASEFEHVFPELKTQVDFVQKVVLEEERSFLRTLEAGLKRFETITADNGVIEGNAAFELYDTYGFPIDLTRLLAEENNWTVDEPGFEAALNAQKSRSRADSVKEMGDWTNLLDNPEVVFVGYDTTEVEDAKLLKYRTVKVKDKPQYQVVLNKTPFYAESGGQHGDKGMLVFGEEKISVLDTQKENDLIIHIVNKLPQNQDTAVVAKVDPAKRLATSSNHSAAHLMHAAMHEILGKHALQRGQDVNEKRMRFDFSHFQKVSAEEIKQIEQRVNEKIRENIALEENRSVPIEEAKAAGALMLFGEKYGDSVRVISFDKDFSSELCGGTHVSSTGEIGSFKILQESAVAAGVRRIEAVTAVTAEAFILKELEELESIRALFKNAKDTSKMVGALQEENKSLKKQIEQMMAVQANVMKHQLISKVEKIGEINFLAAKVDLSDSNALKTLAYNLEKAVGNAVLVFGAEIKGKPQLMVTISKELTENSDLHAGNMVRELAKEIRGGGGGQAFFATAGGSDANGIDAAIAKAKSLLQ